MESKNLVLTTKDGVRRGQMKASAQKSRVSRRYKGTGVYPLTSLASEKDRSVLTDDGEQHRS
jgi:hypothetical protein